MKALSLTQPWASLVVHGAKQIETRTWATKHRGQLAIHASKSYPEGAREFAEYGRFKSALKRLGLDPLSLPMGCVLGTVNVVGCYEILPFVRSKELHGHVVELGYVPPPENSDEFEFGGWGSGRWAWVLETPTLLHEGPVACRGALGLWDWHAN